MSILVHESKRKLHKCTFLGIYAQDAALLWGVALAVLHQLFGGCERSAATQKQCVQLAHSQLMPSWAAMVALVGALGDFHLA
jgi:hypothetical protein